MAYADEALKQTKKRQWLVKMSVGYRVDNIWGQITPNLFRLTIPEGYVENVKNSGTVGTRVTGTPSSNNEWSVDSDNVFTIYLNAVAVSTVVVVFYKKFFSTVKSEYLPVNPDSSGNIVEWVPRLSDVPKISESCDSVLDGFLTVGDTSISLINNDGFFSRLASAPYSLANKSVDIYSGINGVYKYIFKGKIQSFSSNESNCSMAIKSTFENFTKPCYYGDDYSDCFHDFGDNPTLDPNSGGAPKPILIERYSEFSLISNYDAITDIAFAKIPDIETMREAVCTNFSQSTSITTNREYYICRLPEDKLDVRSETINANISHGVDYSLLDASFGGVWNNFQVGEIISIEQGVGTYYARILAGTGLGRNLYITKLAALVSGPVKVISKGINLYVNDGVKTFHVPYNAYTISSAATSGGNVAYSVTLIDNAEALIGLADPIDPQVNRIGFWVKVDPSLDIDVGTILCKMVELAGNEVASSFVHGSNCKFSLPIFDETDYPSYSEVMGVLLQNTFRGVGIDDDQKLSFFKCNEDPLSYKIRNRSNVMGLNMSQDYQDIAAVRVYQNPHKSAVDGVTSSFTRYANNYSGKYLDESDRTLVLTGYVEPPTFDTYKITGKRTLYNIETDIDDGIIVGEGVELSDKTIISANGTIKGRVLARENEENLTKLIISDFT